jgi:cytosine/uracil/thiamine/allantoin permease
MAANRRFYQEWNVVRICFIVFWVFHAWIIARRVYGLKRGRKKGLWEGARN